MNSKKQKPETKARVYLGPTIRGVIQNGSIFTGTEEEIANILKDATGRYPNIAKLVVDYTEVAEVRNKIKNGVNSYAVAYKSLTGGTN